MKKYMRRKELAMRELQISSNDGVHQLHVVVWEPSTEVKAVLQISHGMVEFIERYDDFAKFLNEKGVLVIGNDHIGHGQTAGCDEDLGYFCKENKSETVVKDLHAVTEYAKKEYPNVPYFLFGHSMGSFMARRYLMTYGTELTGAIICGTGRQAGIKLMFGKFVCAIMKLCKGERFRSDFLKQASFGTYNKRFEPIRTNNDWLTKDETIVDWYNAHKFCSFQFTINGYETLFDVLTFIQKKENVEKIPKKLPIFMIAGEEDPVGDYGAGVKKVYELYKASGVEDISLKLYPTDRHEIINETDRKDVYQDVWNWLSPRM